MKFIYQTAVILAVTLAGELLHSFIPLPVPASIYGLIIMLICLCTKVIKLEQTEETGDFMLQIMPLMFIPGGAGLILAWGELKEIILPVTVITVLTTVIVMVVTGKVTELVMKLDRRHRDE